MDEVIDIEGMNRSIFANLSDETGTSLFEAGVTEELRKGEILFHEKDELAQILIVLDGFVTLYRNGFQGGERVIFICSNGEVLNEVCLEREKTSIAARTLSEVKLLRIPREAFLQLAEKDCELEREIFRSLAQKTRRLYHKVGNDNGTYALRNRLAANLWRMASEFGHETDRGRTVSFEVTVNLLSNMMGAKRETVSRTMAEMKKSGLIVHRRGELTIPDMRKLKNSIGA